MSEFKFDPEKARELGEALLSMQVAMNECIRNMSIAAKIMAENNLRLNNELEIDDEEDQPSYAKPEPEPEVWGVTEINGVVYEVPPPPAEFQIAQYPGGKALATSTSIESIVQESVKYSPEAVRFLYRRREKQPWMPLPGSRN